MKTRTKSANAKKKLVIDLDDTESEDQLDELKIPAYAFQSVGFNSPTLSNHSKATIIYPDLHLKSW